MPPDHDRPVRAGSAHVERPATAGTGELQKRVVAGVVMAAAAIVVTLQGGFWFVLFWIAAGTIVFWEWRKLTAGAPDGARWLAAGVIYSLAAAWCPILLRLDADFGLIAILFLFGVVWGTDIAAYFSGRFFGGPKLWPAVSPKKTWSGALGGLFCALIVAFVVASFAALSHLALILLAAVLSIASQAGDLFESHLKRRFGVKDSSQIIPGHGGLMDRLDGFIFAAAIALLIALLRGQWSTPGRGLLEW